MKKVIQCPCGSIIEGQNDDDVVKKAQEHARTTHGMELSPEQALGALVNTPAVIGVLSTDVRIHE